MNMKHGLLAFIAVVAAEAPAAEIAVPIHYLRVEVEAPPTLSNLEEIPEDLGLAGARLGLSDNATTGRFLGHLYSLAETSTPPGEDPLPQARAALAETALLIVDAPAAALLDIADLPEAKDALIFNAAAADDALRDDACRANVLHSAASFAMRADALGQFLLKKRWTRLAMIAGAQPDDAAYADALKAAATKLGLEVVGEKAWRFDADMRRNAAQEVPVFTQDFDDHDVLVVVDEIGDFGRYVLFNAWTPRPVVGSEGLVAASWSPAVEQWGAAQLQSRFHKSAERAMRPRDYAAWAAVRSIGEAVTRAQTDDAAELRAFILSDDFALAGFKGRPMSYRAWNGQLRQPIPLVHPRALAALAPIDGFLHERTELDTLGLDAPQSRCAAFQTP